MRMTDHQRALRTCLTLWDLALRQQVVTCGPGSADAVVKSPQQLVQKHAKQPSLLCSCYALLPRVELSDSESVSESLLERAREGVSHMQGYFLVMSLSQHYAAKLS